jgi:hypothetical protein
MHIRHDEALVLLTNWRNRKTPLNLNTSRSGLRQQLRGWMIGSLADTVVEVVQGELKLTLDVRGAEFNGGDSPRGYLVCEFRDGDRYSFTT